MTATPARRRGATARTRVVEHAGERRLEREDRLAVEEPLEIRVDAPGLPPTRVGVTMRTPGHDFELAAGWLAAEGVLAPGALDTVRYCTDEELTPDQELNVVTVGLRTTPATLPAARLVTAACGVCGADSVRDVARPVPPVEVRREVLHAAPAALREHQPGFGRTGGLHAAGLLDLHGSVVVVREDVGRHNAVDKVVGSRLLAGAPVPPVLALSGRIGFELVQKAALAGVPVVVAVGAPSSLAQSLAEACGMVLAGFTSAERTVVYAGADRVTG